mmetsp:Transcript_31975/g.56505  ORF Transcript_31975/g.56505 Transcript_31975/m.56505 type:complete len:204 (+) Transcript_31975:1916-2527(+)
MAAQFQQPTRTLPSCLDLWWLLEAIRRVSLLLLREGDVQSAFLGSQMYGNDPLLFLQRRQLKCVPARKRIQPFLRHLARCLTAIVSPYGTRNLHSQEAGSLADLREVLTRWSAAEAPLVLCMEELNGHLCWWIPAEQLVELVADHALPPEGLQWHVLCIGSPRWTLLLCASLLGVFSLRVPNFLALPRLLHLWLWRQWLLLRL